MAKEKISGFSRAQLEEKYAIFKAKVDAQVLKIEVFALEDKMLDCTLAPSGEGQKVVDLLTGDMYEMGHLAGKVRKLVKKLYQPKNNREIDRKIASLTPQEKSIILAQVLKEMMVGFEYLIPHVIAQLSFVYAGDQATISAIFGYEPITEFHFSKFQKAFEIFAPAFLRTPDFISESDLSIPEKIGFRISHSSRQSSLQRRVDEFNKKHPTRALPFEM